MRSLAILSAAVCAAISMSAQSATDDMDARIRVESEQRTQVERVFRTMTSIIGPRLTASPAHKLAATFARDELASYGLTDARLESWPFGPGWTLERLTADVIAPRYMPLIAYADAWSTSTAGDVIATPRFVGDKSAAEIDSLAAELSGGIVLEQPMMTGFVREDRAQPDDVASRPPPESPETRAARIAAAERDRAREQAVRRAAPAVVLKPSPGEHGTVFVAGSLEQRNAPPALTVSAEHYNMLVRLLQDDRNAPLKTRSAPLSLRINLQTRFHDEDGGKAYNVLAELPGNDPAVRDEIVMLGAHLDSWHTSPGATDNADGVASVIEAMRILRAVGARPRRTIRVALWGGEEQGLLGSKAWVQQHMVGDDKAVAREHFDVYLNLDAGTGRIYGWYMQLNDGARSMFDTWLRPLARLGVRGNVQRPIGGSDHVSFVEANLPAFTAIQDYVNYDVRTHHTNMDTPERLILAEISQAAAVLATFAMQAADSHEKVPRAALRLR